MDHYHVGRIKLDIIHPFPSGVLQNLANNTDPFARYAENQASVIRNREETPALT
jgi:hypothetical protein